MADKITLSEGALRLIMRGGDFKDPIMQVLGSKHITPASTETERIRLLLSDGKYATGFAMLTTPINNKISSGELATNSIIKIKRYVTSIVNNADKGNKRVLAILEMEILVPGGKTSKIGNPEQLPEDDVDMDVSVTNGHFNSTSSNRSVAVASAIRHDSGDLNMSLLDHLTHPISSLSLHQNKWVIKARVSYKSPIRTCSNSHCEGVFFIDLIDESGEIRATALKDLVDKFYDMIEVNKVYYISKCTLKVANIQLTTLKNYYEMTFTNDTIVQECHDVISSIPFHSGDLNMSLLDHLTHPISSLSPHQNKWVIKARVSYKSPIRTYSNSHWEGVFFIDLIDESGEIRATAVKNLADKFYNMIEVDKVYYISNCTLKVANIQLTTLKNYYEMTFTNDTIVQECHDVISSIPQIQNESFSIDKIANIKTETLTDINRVCKTASATIQNQLTEMNLDIKKTIEGNKNISEEMKQLRAAIENREKIIESQNEKISRLQEKIENQEVKIDSLEKQTKKRNLICNGVEEKSQENKKRQRENLCSW